MSQISTHPPATRVRISRFHGLLLLLLVVYGAVAIWLGPILEFEFMQSDVLSYWHNSIDWRTPFHLHHVPGYPLAVALVRGLTFGIVPPLGLMMGINLVAFIACAVLTYRLIQISQAGEAYALAGTALFCLFPLVGVVNAVYPIADLPVLALFLAGLYAILRHRMWSGAALMGLALFTHKGIWVFVAPVLLVALAVPGTSPFPTILDPRRLLRRRSSRHSTPSAPPTTALINVILFLLLTAAPLLILWVLGAFHHGDPAWIFTTDLGEVQQGLGLEKPLPLLDGLIGTLRLGGLRAIIKGGALYGVFLGALALLWANLRFRPPFYQYGAAIAIAVIISAMIINTPLAWAVVRFGRLLVLPLAWTAARSRSLWPAGFLSDRFTGRSGFFQPTALKVATVAVLILLITSQFLFAWYMAAIYYQVPS